MSQFEMDPDVVRVLTFMQQKIRPPKLVAVARAVAQIADLVWKRFEQDNNDPADKFKPFGFSTASKHDFTQPSCSSRPPLDTTRHDAPD